MSRVIIIGTHGHGHVNPTLPVVSQLVQNGHEVIYYNDEEFHANIGGAGAEFRPYPSDVDTSPDRLARAVNGHMMDITLHLFEVSMTLTQYMLDEIQRENPTALIFDSVALWGLQAARLTGIPAVSSITIFVTKGIDVPLKVADYLHFLRGAIVRLPRFINQRRTLVKRYGRDSLPAKGIFPGTGSMNIVGSSHKCMHDLAPGRSATAVGRRCGCARARYAAVQSSVAQLTAACAGPALGGGPARRQPDQTQAADSMALTWPRTVKASGTRPRLSPMFCAGAERSLTVQPPWNWQPRHDSGVCCGRTFREPATPLQIQTVFFSHVSH